jgi:hypothetical protein
MGEMTVEDMTIMLQRALLSMKITIRTECGKYSVEEWKFEDPHSATDINRGWNNNI